MKIRDIIKTIVCLCLFAGVGAMSFAPVAGYALRAEERVVDLPRKAVLSGRARRSPAAFQRSAADRLGNLEIIWDSDTGAPGVVRGLDKKGAIARFAVQHNAGDEQMQRTVLGLLGQLKDVYGIQDPEREFRMIGVARDQFGFAHVRVQQVRGGIDVDGGVLIAHFNQKGLVYEVNGKYFPGLECETQARVSANAAVEVAEDFLSSMASGGFVLSGEPVLVVNAVFREPCLAWNIVLRSVDDSGLPDVWRVWVDASDGTVVNVFNDIHRIKEPGDKGSHVEITGRLLKGEGGGAANVAGWFDDKEQVYFLHNTNLRWTVFNSAATGYLDSREFAYRSVPDWGDSDRVQMSAARSFEFSQEYFARIHGRFSYDDDGAYATAVVHVGVSYANAYWDGFAFHFGDGDKGVADPLGVLDICAHEFTHAVTHYSAGLYYQNESGALNESFSDIFGALAEFHCQPDGRKYYPEIRPGRADWLIGEDSWLASTALRDMRNPASDVTLEEGAQQPSRYRGSHWYVGMGDNGGVHQNNGVQNFFFYLLCEGGEGSNDGLEYSVEGIGITNAGQVAYRALTVYCTPLTNFRDAREAWVSAAADINTNWIASVSDAWDAVGVSARGRADALPTNDYNADGASDLALYEWLSGDWYIASLEGDVLAWDLNFGAYSFVPVPGDYDGGGAADLAVYCEQTGEWYVLIVETSEIRRYQFGGPGYAPVPGDYDGDGITDLAVYYKGTGSWYIWSLDGHILAWGVNFGAPGFVPVPGDYDAGGETDYAVYDSECGVWYFRHIETGLQDSGLFGGPALVPAQGDYDGDGMTDPAVYDIYTGNWYVWSKRGALVYWGFQFGGPGLMPVPGDYNADGRTDIAVYQESTGRWYIYIRESGQVICFDFGGPGFLPVGAWHWRNI